MSIYCTLWSIKISRNGSFMFDGPAAEIFAQSVPAFIGHPAEGYGYERGDPYADFLPPPWPGPDPEADGVPARAVVIVQFGRDEKGDEKNSQRYLDPLCVLTGAEYAAIGFGSLLDRIEAGIDWDVAEQVESEEAEDLAQIKPAWVRVPAPSLEELRRRRDAKSAAED